MVTDELHALSIGRKIVRDLHLAGVTKRVPEVTAPSREAARDPCFSPEELRGIIPADSRESYDVRSIISRIVDASEFDEFKKLYGPVSFQIITYDNLSEGE